MFLNFSSVVEQLYCERDKLRADISESNVRANLLAQEMDEHHNQIEVARQDQIKQLEQKHNDAIRELSNQLNVEREKNSNTLKSLEEQLFKSRAEEQRIKNELTKTLKEIHSLEIENHHQSEEILKLEYSRNQLVEQVKNLTVLSEQVIKL